ncbi:UNVERIFIED_CONTAM: hypothetical protein Sradi_6390000 [Sesamum radiatum]|uniref:Uncharacterized protein n=1 Tax=Sesamum radiatum TaxID=300843 RepID=A0AAW2K4K8_SESRA
MSGATRGGWIVAACIGAVEALKDQLGFCRWNYGWRMIQQQAKTTVQSYYHTHLIPPPPPPPAPNSSDDQMVMRDREKIERREKGVKKVMELSCWGPPTVRF